MAATDPAIRQVSVQSDDEDVEEDEEEPKLKYERIGNSLQEILHQDAASCMAVHQKFLALGTHWGVVHIFDHQGNNIRSKDFPSHTTTVNQISIDANGDYIASCAEDGRVAINGLYTPENNTQLTFDCPVRAIGLHPDFGKRGNKQYVIGVGEKLVLYEKGWLRNKSTVVHVGEGFVRSIKWRGNFIAWANSVGVEVYDTNAKERISHIQRDGILLRDDLFHCNICWKDDHTLLIAWGNAIKVCMVKERTSDDVRDLPTHYVEIVHMFTVDFFACGIAPFDEDLAVLAYFVNKDDQGVPKKGGGQRPQLLILVPQGIENYIETSTDALSVRGFEEYLCNHYRLEPVQEERLFYVVSPKDIVIARPRDLDDHITWLIEREYFKEALEDAEKNHKDLKVHTVLNIGRTYLSFLTGEGKYEEAAQLCDRVLGQNQELWEEEIYKFAKYHQLKVITPYIPCRNPQLGNIIYEMVLNAFLESDCEGFQQLINTWPRSVYRESTIIIALQNKLKEEPDNATLLRTLGTLYVNSKKFDKGLQIYMILEDSGVFDMICEHQLFQFINDKLLQLMLMDSAKATKMFIDHMQVIPMEAVVKQIKSNKALLFQYLHGVFLKDRQAGPEFHDLQVELHAEFDRPGLLPFLKGSNYYQLEKALKVCEERQYIPEMVFLHGRMGNNKKALSLIIDKMNDIEMAIEFAKDENDEDLWDDLINLSLRKPEFIKELLFNIGTHVNPIKLIKRIQPGLPIPNLRDALVKILQDYNLQVDLHKGCKTILDKDSVALMQRQLKVQSKGYAVMDSSTCDACHGCLIVDDSRKASSLVVFFCQHSFHDVCLQQTQSSELRCTICSIRKSKQTKRR